ncbi:MAG: phage holin family protein [Actinobacteria bacterium]|nr:phage holin family protein [Actinomycetota bacterium]
MNGERAGIGSAAKQVAEQASALARLELELAALELKRKAAALGLGIGMGLGAAVFGLMALGFMFATVAAALATFLPTWLSLLVVTVFLLLVAAVLGMVALRSVRKGVPPVPKQAIEEAKRTQAALKGHGSR